MQVIADGSNKGDIDKKTEYLAKIKMLQYEYPKNIYDTVILSPSIEKIRYNYKSILVSHNNVDEKQ